MFTFPKVSGKLIVNTVFSDFSYGYMHNASLCCHLVNVSVPDATTRYHDSDHRLSDHFHVPHKVAQQNFLFISPSRICQEVGLCCSFSFNHLKVPHPAV